MTRPDYLGEFVLPTAPATAIECGAIDLYLPPTPRVAVPVTILVHGGPMREAPVVPPRQWPVFRGYAAALVARGIAAAMFDHALLRSLDYGTAVAQLAEVIDTVRAQPAVASERVALWFFSGGGPLAASALRDRPPWLRILVLSYPMLRPLNDVAGFAPAAELGGAGQVPMLLTRVGKEFPRLAAEQDEFAAAARSQGVDLTVIEVPDGQHGFDVADDTDQSRQALNEALDFVQAQLAEA